MTKKNNLRIVLKTWVVIFFTLSLSSCFEFIQEMNLNADGSGHFRITVNFSQSTARIDILRLLDDVNGHQIPTNLEMRKQIANFADSARVSPGISNVFSRFDEQNYILEFACNFDRVERLNDRIFSLWRQKEPAKAIHEEYCSYAGNVLKIDFGTKITTLFRQMTPADREVLVGADYTSILRFDTEVISQTNRVAKIIPNKKVIIVQSPVLILLQDPYLFNNTIKLKI